MSAGRYVVVCTQWNHFVDPHKEGWLAPRLESGAIPAGTKVVAQAEVSGPAMNYEHQWLGLAFPSATTAKEWIDNECAEWDEDKAEYPRFMTLSALESHLDDVSTSRYLGLR